MLSQFVELRQFSVFFFTFVPDFHELTRKKTSQGDCTSESVKAFYNWVTKTYTYTAYTEAEYQGVTNQVPYTGGGTDTYTQHHQRPPTPSNLRGGVDSASGPLTKITH